MALFSSNSVANILRYVTYNGAQEKIESSRVLVARKKRICGNSKPRQEVPEWAINLEWEKGMWSCDDVCKLMNGYYF